MIANLRIVPDDLSRPEVLALLQFHLDEMHQWSPACKVHAMPAERLRQRDVAFFSAWAAPAVQEGGPEDEREVLAGCGAIKHLDDTHGELKSMRVTPACLGQGVGRAILLHLISQARGRGYRRVSLETGRPAPFLPAQRLYAAHGFVECPPFGDYVSDDFSMCMTLELGRIPA